MLARSDFCCDFTSNLCIEMVAASDFCCDFTSNLCREMVASSDLFCDLLVIYASKWWREVTFVVISLVIYA